MRILVVIHHRDAATGVFAEPALAAGHELVEWLPPEAPPPALDGYGAAFVFGGEQQVDQEDAHPWLRPEKRFLDDLLESGTPLLGICLGSQLLAQAAGAEVRRAARPEIGWHEIELTPEGGADPVLGELPQRFEGFGYHHYEGLLPPGAAALARSPACLQAFRLAERPVWGMQFHPEVTLTDLSSWLDGWDDDPWAVATGLDPGAIRAESRRKIDAWNEVGRGISQRFLEFAGAYSGVR